MRIPILILIFLMAMFSSNQAQEIANIGVEGWAAYTKGGRGGRIVRVTNLNSSGKGSFAEAIAASDPRMVVFEVGGIIDFEGISRGIKHPFITIAGQTAPSPGITIINGALSIQTHDVILQHIRVRPGANVHDIGWEPDGISAVSAYNVIIDHCSVSWAVDENCSASGPRFEGLTPDDWRANTSHTITMSNNIIAEGLSNATHTKGEHSKGTLIHDNATEIAILNNLYSSNKDRNPLFKGGARGVIANNYIYNPGSSAIRYGLVDSEWLGYEYQIGKMSVVGNVLQYGPGSGSMPLCKIGFGPCEVYLSDNIAKDNNGNNVAEYSGDMDKIVDASPVWHPNLNLLPSSEVKESIIKNVGARPWDRDETDKRIIEEMINGTGKIIDLETEVGGYPVHEPTSAAFFEEDWNLDIMMKISPDISIINPINDEWFVKDSVFLVEAVVDDISLEFNSLELMINGISFGKIFTPPYKWYTSINSLGEYELVVLADKADSMRLATASLRINIDEPIWNVRNIDVDNPSRFPISIFPNPFSSSTTFSYHLDKAEFVELGIFTAMGQPITTLVSLYQPEGKHEFSFSSDGLIPGLYFYSLMKGNYSTTGKLILEK